MANSYGFGGPVNNTNYRTYYPGGFLYTDGYAMPSGNLNLAGARPIRVYRIDPDWHTGATWCRLNYQNSGEIANGFWGSSGGTFRIAVGREGSSALGAGRNTGNGLTLRDSGDGSATQGGIAGTLQWSTVPTIPQAISPSRSGTSIVVNISGSASDGGAAIQSYHVQYSKDGGAWTGAQNASSGTTTFGPGLSMGSSYKFRVYANNENGSSQARESGSVSIPSTPGTPGGLAVQRSSRNILFSWNAPGNGGAGITSYILQYTINGGASWNAYGSLADTAYWFTNLARGATFHFRVAAVNEMGQGGWATSAGTLIPTYPGAPTLQGVLPTEDGKGAQVLFTASGATNGGAPVWGMRLQRATNAAFTANVTTVTIPDGTAFYYNATGLSPSATYWWRLTLYNEASEEDGYLGGNWSNVVSQSQPDPSVGTMRNAANTGWVDVDGRIHNGVSWVPLDGRIRNAANTGWVELG